jgi:hypothetical protein
MACRQIGWEKCAPMKPMTSRGASSAAPQRACRVSRASTVIPAAMIARTKPASRTAELIPPRTAPAWATSSTSSPSPPPHDDCLAADQTHVRVHLDLLVLVLHAGRHA